ncbi:MAG: lamin tail domain-containing protein [Pirellulaceae bacterium]|nr:lamin tail domain-containing protein [Planctomycetales bacterium]
MRRTGTGSRRSRRLCGENLEERRVLATTPIINEFVASNSNGLQDGDGNYSDWIEIYNPLSTSFDLTGWGLSDDAAEPLKWTFPSTTVQPNSYLVVIASGQTSSNYVDSSGYRHTNFRLGADGEPLILSDSAGQFMDGFTPSYPPQSANVSYGLGDGGIASYFTHPTPGTANDVSSAFEAAVQISEIMYHAPSESALDEFIELWNPTTAAVDLNGWRLSGGIDFTFPAVTIPAGGYYVVAADMTAFASLHSSVTNVVGNWNGVLSNGGETIRLTDNLGRPMDVVTYSDEGQWSDRTVGELDLGHRGWSWSDAHDGGGSSLELITASLSNQYGQNWAASTVVGGTPGSPNSVADEDNNVAPLILNVAHTPVIPSTNDSVIVTARLLDEQATGVSATLYWKLDAAGSFSSLAMNDSGLAGDAVAGDGVFSATIPPQSDRAIVEFYVQSTDADANSRSYPTATQPSGLQQTNLLYQVDNSFDPNTVIGPDDMPQYRLIMKAVERTELAQIASSSATRRSHALMNGTFISLTAAGLEYRYTVGIRNRGFGSASRLPQSYHVDMPSDTPWADVNGFNLNTQYTQSQIAGLKLFQAAGLIAEDAQPVQVRVNGLNLSNAGTPSYGVYVQLESPDSLFAANHFPGNDNGNLYRVIRDANSNANGDLRYLGPNPDSYRPYYDKKTNVSEDDFSDIIQLTNVLNNAPDEDYYQLVTQLVDIDNWLGYFATIALLGNEETMLGIGVGDDYILYRGNNDPRFRLIPHDMDTVLGEGDTAGSPTRSIYRATSIPTIERFLTHPQIMPAYHAKLQELLDGAFSKPAFDALLDGELTSFAPAARISSMKAFMDARRTYVSGIISQPLSVTASLPIAAGFPHSTQNRVALSGTAPRIGTTSVLVDGYEATLDVENGTWSFGQSEGGQPVTFISRGAVWQYLDAGQVPSTAAGNDWRINDPGWTQSGQAKLGYGDGDEVTTITYIDTNQSAPGTQKNITTYFRRTFNVADASAVTSLNLGILRDDGAVIYINGVHELRSNMPTGTITSTTLASATVGGTDETRFFDLNVDPAWLVDGENVIAVELHQVANDSSDLGFDLQLTGTVGTANSQGGVPLVPGINRVEVAAYRGPHGTGEALGSTHIDIWYDGGSTTNVSGTINGNTTWTAAGGPYVVTGDITVAANATLTIEAGTTVFYNAGTGLTVHGRLLALGSEGSEIYMAGNPANGVSQWDGMTISDTAEDTQLQYVLLHGGDGLGQALLVDNATATLDHVEWLGIDEQVLDLAHPKLIVRNSIIPSIGGNETAHLFGLDQDEFLIFENNVFGFNNSGDDMIDLGHETLTPGTIIFRGNTLLGGRDDGIDTDGFPVLIENNYFTNFHYNSSRSTTSNAISTGHVTVSGQTLSSDLTIRGNVFVGNDHGLLLKDFSYAVVTNNTFIDSTIGAVHFAEPNGSAVIGPGRGGIFDGNIFWNNVVTFEQPELAAEITLEHSIVTPELLSYSNTNIGADPMFVDLAAGDYRLQRESPAVGTGPGGSDMGALQINRYTPASSANLRISEIHYNPLPGDFDAGEVAADGDMFEFLELINVGDEPIDTTDVAIVDGVQFVFPWQTTLQPGERALLVSDPGVFRSRYGNGPEITGVYSGNLANSGETLRIVDAAGSPIAVVSYDDVSPWPTAPDGSGPSLVIVDLDAAASNPTNWTASLQIGGSPGADNVPPVDPDFNADGNVNAADLTIWQNGLGTLTNAAHAQGDADGDRDVDGIDFLAWQRAFTGATTTALAESVSLSAATSESATPSSRDTHVRRTVDEIFADPSATEEFVLTRPHLRLRSATVT